MWYGCCIASKVAKVVVKINFRFIQYILNWFTINWFPFQCGKTWKIWIEYHRMHYVVSHDFTNENINYFRKVWWHLTRKEKFMKFIPNRKKKKNLPECIESQTSNIYSDVCVVLLTYPSLWMHLIEQYGIPNEWFNQMFACYF